MSDVAISNPEILPIFPYRLDRLKDKINAVLARREKTEANWVKETLELCTFFAEARAECPDDIGFGRWCDTCQFKLNHQDRAAAIAMGQNLELTKQFLLVTERRSIANVYRFEIRPAVRGVARIRQKNPAKSIEQAGVTHVRKPKSAVPTVTDAQIADMKQALPTEARGQLDAIKAHLETQIEERAKVQSQIWLEQERIPSLEKRIDDLEMLLSKSGAVMTSKEYKHILMCIHPDGMQSRTKEQLEEAFRIFTSYKLMLVDEPAERAEELRKLRSIPLPAHGKAQATGD